MGLLPGRGTWDNPYYRPYPRPARRRLASATHYRYDTAEAGRPRPDQTNFHNGPVPPVRGQPLEPYRRQATPTRNPSPSAIAAIDSGRSRMTSSSVSPIE